VSVPLSHYSNPARGSFIEWCIESKRRQMKSLYNETPTRDRLTCWRKVAKAKWNRRGRYPFEIDAWLDTLSWHERAEYEEYL